MRKGRRGIKEIEKDLNDCADKQRRQGKTLKKLSEKELAFEEERIAVLRSTRIQCPHCDERSTLSKWVFIQTFRDDRMLTERVADWRENHYTNCWVCCPKCGEKFFFQKFPHQNKLREFAEKIAPRCRFSRLFGRIERMEIKKEEEVTAEMFSK